MTGGVVQSAVPALYQGLLHLDWIDSHVKWNQSSTEQRQDRKSFPLPPVPSVVG
jgi:hypothetical protein